MSASSCRSASMSLMSSGESGRSMGGTSSCLLRRHRSDLPRLQIELDPADTIKVRAGDPNEARPLGIIDRMNGTVLVDAGLSRVQAVFLRRPQRGMARVGAVVLA